MNNEIIEVLTKMLECEGADSCNFNCSKCNLFTRAVDRSNALIMAIEALEQQNHRCHNCCWKEACKITQIFGIDGFCSEWKGKQNECN